MTRKHRTVRITAQMITDLELVLNVPADMDDRTVYEKVRFDGEIDGGLLTEVKDSAGDWVWGSDVEELPYNPSAPVHLQEPEDD